MSTQNNIILKDCVVVGAGISGIAIARWLKQYDIDFVVLEKSDDIAGLWRFQENGYGVMSFTHINVSKYNYCFSDYPIQHQTDERMHHTQIYEYVKSYCQMHKLFDFMRFKNEVVLIEEFKKSDVLYKSKIEFPTIRNYEKIWKVTTKDLNTNTEKIYITPNVSIATGHHHAPRYFEFQGQNTFPGEIIHSVKYKDSKLNKMEGKRVLLVGIGNSSVDIADNLVTEGRSPDVTISARNGSWIFPSYLNGFNIDLYPSRFVLAFHWKIKSIIFENIIRFVSGDPKKYNLNPTLRMFQALPTISPTLIQHIQAKRVHIMPNIKYINGKVVTFDNGEKKEFDAIILCTGYKIDLGFLHSDIRKLVFENEQAEVLNLFKLVFQPTIGSSLSFIGMVQPLSGGTLLMSEVQARWVVYLIRNKIKFPTEEEMKTEIIERRERYSSRFMNRSLRHTIPEDPITYNDGIAKYYGAKPDYLKNITIAWRLLFGSNGPAQWRLNGIDAMENAAEIVKSVPVTSSAKFVPILLLILLLLVIMFFIYNPVLIPLMALPYVIYSQRSKLFK